MFNAANLRGSAARSREGADSPISLSGGGLKVEEEDGVVAHVNDLMGGGTRNRSCRCHPFLQRMVCRH